MPTIELKQEVLAPHREWVAEFKNVHHPTSLLQEMNDIAKWNWRITSARTFTDRIEWDVTGDPISWFGEWRYKDVQDRWTVVWIKVICQGTYDKKTKTGNVTIRVKPVMTTKFEWNNPIIGVLYWFYFHTFYRSQIRRYIEESQIKVRTFDVEIRERLGIVHAVEREKVTRRPK